jgi:RNA polymerase sigma-70 factor, ECF subfamily
MTDFLDVTEKSDEELVALTLEDQSNFSFLVQRYQDKLSRYIHRLSGLSSEEIEDLLQNIFIKAYLNLNDFDGRLKFSSWLYRIAHNEAIDHYRKNQARPQLLDVDISESYVKELAGDDDLLSQLARQELKIIVQAAIGTLDYKLREIIILKFIEEKDYQEISDIIKKPMGTVASRLNKAKAELRKILVSNKKL